MCNLRLYNDNLIQNLQSCNRSDPDTTCLTNKTLNKGGKTVNIVIQKVVKFYNTVNAIDKLLCKCYRNCHI